LEEMKKGSRNRFGAKKEGKGTGEDEGKVKRR